MEETTQLVHTRLPVELHKALKYQADSEGVSLQRVIVRRLNESIVGARDVGIDRVFDSRFNVALRTRLLELSRTATRVQLVGTSLLDFLGNGGSSDGVLQTSPIDAPMALILPDPNSDAVKLKLKLQLGTAFESHYAAKIAELQYAIAAATALCRDRNGQVLLTSVYPCARWIMQTQGATLYEPHMLRMVSNSPTDGIPQAMPVFEFEADSPGARRISEYIDTCLSNSERGTE